MKSIFIEAFNILKGLEYSTPSTVLHKNKNEKDITFYGIYRYAHPHWQGWDIVDRYIAHYKGNIRDASKALSKDAKVESLVHLFYIRTYWQRHNIHTIKSQTIANEIFIFAVNNNPYRAIRFAQKIVGVKADGIIGRRTLLAFESADISRFTILYDKHEIGYYVKLVRRNSNRYLRYLSGWVNRAFRV